MGVRSSWDSLFYVTGRNLSQNESEHEINSTYLNFTLHEKLYNHVYFYTHGVDKVMNETIEG